jgi:transposase
VKAFAAYLGEYANVPINKVSETIAVLTGGLIRLSYGTVVNIYSTLSSLVTPIITDIKNALIISGVLGADETGVRVNGQLNWVQVFSTQLYTLYGYDEKRGELCADKLGVLAFFTGILVHDHFKSYYKYEQMSHAECNAHILRYLKSMIQIFGHSWAAGFTQLLKEALTLKNQSLEQNFDSVMPEKYAAIAKRYDEVLAIGVTEYEQAIKGKSEKGIEYYNDEKCLLKRLRDYKIEHLRFLTSAEVPFSNNNSEQAVGAFKRKVKTAGCFRSPDGADDFTRIASVIQTLKKQKKNVYEKLCEIFEGHTNGLLGTPQNTGG